MRSWIVWIRGGLCEGEEELVRELVVVGEKLLMHRGLDGSCEQGPCARRRRWMVMLLLLRCEITSRQWCGYIEIFRNVLNREDAEDEGENNVSKIGIRHY